VEALEQGRVPSAEERELQLGFPEAPADARGPRLLQDVESRHFAESVS